MSVISTLCKIFSWILKLFKTVVKAVGEAIKILGNVIVDVLDSLVGSVGNAILGSNFLMYLGIGAAAFFLLTRNDKKNSTVTVQPAQPVQQDWSSNYENN